MKKTLMLSLMLVIFILQACSGSSDSSENSDEEVIQITVGAPPASSPLYGYWVAATESIESVYPEFNFTVTESQGIVDINERVRSGQVQIGNSSTSADVDNYKGEGSFEGDPFEKSRVLWYYDPSAIQLVVSDKENIESVYELDGKKFNAGTTNGAAEAITKLAFEELGIKPNYFDANQADASDAVVNRQIIGTSKLGPIPDSYIEEIQGSLDVSLLSFEEEDIENITQKHPYLNQYLIEANTYKGIEHDVNTLSILMGAQTTSDLDQETGYKMIKAIAKDGREVWEKAYPIGADNDISELTLQSSVPLHAGAVQFLKEEGHEVPDELIPPEYEEVN